MARLSNRRLVENSSFVINLMRICVVELQVKVLDRGWQLDTGTFIC